ncbi:MAG: four helix bundle protein [Phycisphaerales bacterium]
MPTNFEELEVYVAAKNFRHRIFTLTTKLPPDEKYVLVPQMKRAALAVTNKIAEAHDDADNWKTMIACMHRSHGCINELIDDLGVCADQKYFKPVHLTDLRKDADEVVRLINEYIQQLQAQLAAYMDEQRKKRAAQKSKFPRGQSSGPRKPWSPR